MTDVRASCGEHERETGTGSGLDRVAEPAGQEGYLGVLRIPGALRFCVAGAVGRVPMSMFGLGTLLLIASLTGRYGVAGAVASAGAIGYAVSSALAARLVDRFGQARVLRPSAVVFAIATVAFVACAELHAPLPAVLVTGCLSGASMPSLGSMVRARWSMLLGGSPRLTTAYALESVVDEVIFVFGPAAATLLATEVQPAAGVVTAMVVCVAGTMAFAAQTGTEPLPHAVPRRAASGGGLGRRARRPGAARLPSPALATLAPAFCFLGSMFASVDLSTVAFAQEHGHKPVAGFLLGIYALGSATGGIWYGSRSWRAPLERRFVTTLALTVCGVATFWTAPGLLGLAPVLFCSGLAIAPTLIAGFSLIERAALPGRRTEGMAWLSSTVSVGVAAGSAVCGQVVDAGGARWGYLYAACCGAVTVAICVAGRARLRAGQGAQAAQ
jgi:MFS family permease